MIRYLSFGNISRIKAIVVSDASGTSAPKPPGTSSTSMGGKFAKECVGTTDCETFELKVLIAGRGFEDTGSRVSAIIARFRGTRRERR